MLKMSTLFELSVFRVKILYQLSTILMMFLLPLISLMVIDNQCDIHLGLTSTN